jgi:RNA polymerase sigma-70 factor, ECF subfamily
MRRLRGTSSPPPPISGGDGTNSTSLTLIERVKVHDGEAWQRLVTLYTPLLRHWCHRWGLDDADTDDVLQDVFQAIFSSLKEFRRDREGDSFRGWLRGVARNKTLYFLRRRGSPGQGGTEFLRRSLLVPDPGRDPVGVEEEEGHLFCELYQNALRLVRGEFEDRTWQAFWRAAVEGQSPSVIAEDLGVTAAAVRQAKSRVLRRLKGALGLPASPEESPGSP